MDDVSGSEAVCGQIRVCTAGIEAAGMKATGFNAFMARIDAVEYGLCRRLNRGASFAVPRHLFRIASRLGDGILWYTLILALPLLYGAPGVRPAIVMAFTGLLGVLLYTLVKHLFVRERPFITHT